MYSFWKHVIYDIISSKLGLFLLIALKLYTHIMIQTTLVPGVASLRRKETFLRNFITVEAQHQAETE